MTLRCAVSALLALCGCEVTSTVGYNDGALPLESCAPDASLRACSTENCVVSEIGTAELGIESLAVDSESIFFLSAPSMLVRRPIAGGNLQELTAELDQLQMLTIDDEHVYWTEYDGRTRSVPKGGGPITDVTFVFGHPFWIATDADHVYVTYPESGEVAMAPKPAGMATRLGGQNVPFAVAVDEAHVYWVNQGQPGATNGELVRAPSGDLTGAEVIATGLDAPVALALTADEIVWATFDTVFALPKTGGAPAPLAGGFAEAKAIVAFDGFAYLAGAGGLNRIAIADGTTQLLEPRGLTSVALACDGVFATGWFDPILIRYGR